MNFLVLTISMQIKLRRQSQRVVAFENDADVIYGGDDSSADVLEHA